MLGIEYLEKTEPDEVLSDFRIPNDISGLWKTIDKDENLSEEDYINHLIQWDDAWLLACLRSTYFQRISEIGDPLIIRLEELLSNKKKYISLYKRLDGFEDIDIAVLANLDISILEQYKKDTAVKPTIELVEAYRNDFDLCKEKGYPRVGLFISTISELLVNTGKPPLDQIVKIALKNIASAYEIQDFIVKVNKLKTGIDSTAMIYHDDKVYPLESYSRIKVELEDNRVLFPPFFVYLYTKTTRSEVEVRDSLGKEIAKELNKIYQQ
jgi:hypothetical protein